jgi:glycosyltransferase involved in cell wall biosynthesis
MKIAIVSEGLSTPSGFGQQVRLLSAGLAKRGHEVTVVSRNTRYPEAPSGVNEWRLVTLDNLDHLDRALHQLQPDAVIVLWFTSMVIHLSGMKAAPGNCPVFFWFPWEGSTVPKEAVNWMAGTPRGSVVHLSQFAQKLWDKTTVGSDTVIPHGVDLTIFKKLPERTLDVVENLREKWSERLNANLHSSFLVLNVDRNIRHKRWDATYAFLQTFAKRSGKKVKLIAHTHKVGEKLDGGLSSYDLGRLEEAYDLRGKTAYTGFDWGNGLSREEVAELYHLADLRISTSEGEGFGIPTIEAAACGCPQVLTRHTVMSELLPENSPSLVPPAFMEFDRDSLWAVPNVTAMVDRTLEVMMDADTYENVIEPNYRHVIEKFDSEVVCDQWHNLLTGKAATSTKRELWNSHRWGFRGAIERQLAIRALVTTLAKFQIRKVFEVGSFDGRFLAMALEIGLDATGLEPDIEALQQADLRVRTRIKSDVVVNHSWPAANAVVLNDSLGMVSALHKSEGVRIVLDRVSGYPFAFIQNSPLYMWKEEIPDLSYVSDYLQSKNMTRRHDLEILAKKQDQFFVHEIWQQGQDTSHVPPQLASS